MKKLRIVAATLGFAGALSMAAYAGTWAKNAQGWWYNNGDGTWPVNTWQWIDGNGDGVAECYYFDPSGYCLTNTRTPDGYTVNADGAWTVNGSVQTKQLGQSANALNIENCVGQYKALRDTKVYSSIYTGTTVTEANVSGYSMKVTKASTDSLNFKIDLGDGWGSVFTAKIDSNGVGTVTYVDDGASMEFFPESILIDPISGKIHIVTSGEGDGGWTDTFEFIKTA